MDQDDDANLPSSTLALKIYATKISEDENLSDACKEAISKDLSNGAALSVAAFREYLAAGDQK